MTARWPTGRARRAIQIACAALGSVAAGATAPGCASSGGLAVVPAADLGQASGAPVISAIEDRGGGDIPAVGQVLPVAQDGIAVIGETLLVRGRNFGRQPTVAIAGRAAAVVSRTEDGGILLRVPPGVPAGPQALSVAQEDGRAERSVLVRRLAVACGEQGLVWLDVGAAKLGQLGRAELPNARQVVFSPDGRAGYALDRAGTLHVFEMAAPGAPVRRGQLALPLPVRALLAPAPLPGDTGKRHLVVVGENDVQLVDVSSPLYPVRGASLPLPKWAHGRRELRAALSPDGQQLALALPDHNRLVVVPLSELRAGHDPARAELPIVPEVLAPVIADLTFAPDGKTLWLVSGMTAESRGLGPLRTRVHAVRLATSPTALTLTQARVVELEEVTRPVAIVTGRGMPLASGAAIRLPPERATVHVAAYGLIDGRPTVFSLGADDLAQPTLTDRQAGVVGRPDVSPDEAWLLAPSGDAAGGWRVLGVPPASGARVEVTRLALDAGRGGAAATSSMEIKVQP
jgi:hypothetical protein